MGKFYKAENQYYLFLNDTKRLICISNESFEIKTLFTKWGLNASEGLYKYVLNEVFVYCLEYAQNVEIYKYAYYDPKKFSLYIYNGEKEVLKITPNEISTQENGDEGIMFVELKNYQPFKLVEFNKKINYVSKYLTSKLNVDTCSSLLNANTQRKLATIWFYSLFFESIMKTKPIFTVIGEKGSGKTTFLRRVGQVLFITYLAHFPEKISDYLDEAQILKVKCNFIVYKETKEGEPVDIWGNTCTKKELTKENKRCFDEVQESAKAKILKGIGIEDFIITEDNYEKFNKYFRNFKPEFMKYEKMYKELDKVGFKLKDIFEYSLRDIVYGFYNDSSQVTHGCFLDWNRKSKFTQREVEYIFHFFIKTTLFLKVLLKGAINFDTVASQQYLPEMKQALENLEKLIYGRKLKH